MGTVVFLSEEGGTFVVEAGEAFRRLHSIHRSTPPPRGCLEGRSGGEPARPHARPPASGSAILDPHSEMATPTEDVVAPAPPARARGARLLDWFERVGNRFPDPIVLFLFALAATWAASSLLAGGDFGLVDPRTQAALQINNQLTVRALASFVVGATQAFVMFPPLGMVLVMVIATAVVIVPATWWLVDRVVEPRLRGVVVDGDPAVMPTAPPLTSRERHGLWIAFAVAVALAAAFAWIVAPSSSPMRAADGSLTGPGSPVMQGLIPLVLAFCRRYVTGFQAGTLMSLLLPFGLVYLLLQTVMLLLWWGVGLPLGIGGRYVFP